MNKNLLASTSRLYNPSMWASEIEDSVPFKTKRKINSSSLMPQRSYKGIPFQKYPKRKELYPKIKENTFAPLYNPNKEFSKTRLDKLCVPFNKISSRVDVLLEDPRKNLPFKIGKSKSKNEPITCLLLS